MESSTGCESAPTYANLHAVACNMAAEVHLVRVASVGEGDDENIGVHCTDEYESVSTPGLGQEVLGLAVSEHAAGYEAAKNH